MPSNSLTSLDASTASILCLSVSIDNFLLVYQCKKYVLSLLYHHFRGKNPVNDQIIFIRVKNDCPSVINNGHCFGHRMYFFGYSKLTILVYIRRKTERCQSSEYLVDILMATLWPVKAGYILCDTIKVG